MSLYVPEGLDPCKNLAMEEFLLTRTRLELDIFWRNGPSVIIGRNQNALAELDADYARRHGIQIARRMTGGGAVFHDEGNINYTHLRSYDGTIDFARFARPMVETLRRLGFDAELSGRNDILCNGLKISGTAQTVWRGRVLHHGTLLYSADLSRLAGVLRVRPEKYRGRAIKSVSARVGNLSELETGPADVEVFRRRLIEAWRAQTGDNERYEPGDEVLAGIDRLRREKYAQEDWIFGKPPEYNVSGAVRVPAGLLESYLLVRDGVIQKASLHGDFFSSEDIALLARRLEGQSHRPEALRRLLEQEPRLSAYLPGFDIPDILRALV